MKQLLIFLLAGFLAISAHAQIPSGYYNTATGTGATLKTQLYNIIKGHTSVSYDYLWTAFKTTDDVANQGVYLWDTYSNCNFLLGSDQCGNYSGECSCYNREHSFPKSWFGGTTAPMYTDLFHVIPTDGYVNNQRGNYPYGEVSSPTYTSNAGLKLGPCSYPGYTGTVFEPLDEYKGDMARNYFYMATRYENIISTWYANDVNADSVLQNNSFPVFETWFLNMLGEWNTQDPVSQKEIDRNNAVYAIQNNRNPFIDHPEYVYQIWGVGAVSNLSASASTLSGFAYSGAGPSASQSYTLSGTSLIPASGTITISGSTHFEVSLDNSSFGSSRTISYSSAGLAAIPVYVRLKGNLASGSYSGETITNSGGSAPTVNITCSGTVTNGIKPEPSNFPILFSGHNIHLQWTDATGSTLPDGYLIRRSNVDFASIAAPADGVIYNATGDVYVAYGVQQAWISSLLSNTTYYFKMFPYKNNGGVYNYKTDGTVPQISKTTSPQ